MNRIWNELEALRGSLRSHEMAMMLLREVLATLEVAPELHESFEEPWRRFRDTPSYPHLQAAARVFRDLTRPERLMIIQRLTSSGDDKYWDSKLIPDVPARMIAKLAGKGKSVRCSFGSAAMPALHIALGAREAGEDIHVRFIDQDLFICNLVKLAASAIDVSVEVVMGQPLSRVDGGTFDTEICMPPFGADVRDRNELPRKTLERIDAAERGRLHFEPVAMADMLVHAPGARVVFSFTAGALFRTVGSELVARGEVVDSGRLAAVFAVPPGMVYTMTNLATCIMVLVPEDEELRNVRFIDLADKTFGAKTTRGRYDIQKEASWAGAMESDLAENISWARDVSPSEIREQNNILAVERYLRTESSEALAVFLSDYDTKALSDLVDVIRPSALPKSHDGEYTVREASPGDIDETGVLGMPPRETRVARGALRKARNQQVRPGDILLSVKGTIGRVGIVTDDAPRNDEETFWTAGQSLVILRTRGQIAAEVLYEYLSNDLVQEHIGSLAGGAAIQSISAKDLASLPVPLPPQVDQDRIVEQTRSRRALFEDIERVRREIKRHRSETWPHQTLGVTLSE